ncbi:hypothetical protein IJE86_10250 [bacterium]|nr:hypothetical protein [bacterium]
MIQQAVMLQTQRFRSFMNFARHFLRRQNFLESIQRSISAVFRDIFTVKKKLKMAQYRVNYQQFKLRQMEQLIAENNEHVFLKGNKINELR